MSWHAPLISLNFAAIILTKRQAILGHNSLAVTMDLYCDVMEDTKRKELLKIAEAL